MLAAKVVISGTGRYPAALATFTSWESCRLIKSGRNAWVSMTGPSVSTRMTAPVPRCGHIARPVGDVSAVRADGLELRGAEPGAGVVNRERVASHQLAADAWGTCWASPDSATS